MAAPTDAIKGSLLPTMSALAAGDMFYGRDLSDLSESADGTAKQIPLNLLGPTLNARGVYASLPAASIAGANYHATDGGLLLRDTGSTFERALLEDVPFTVPTGSGWTWANQDSSTITQEFGGIRISKADKGTTFSPSIYYRSPAYSTPYTVTGKVGMSRLGINLQGVGICFRASDGKITVMTNLTIDGLDNLIVGNLNSPTSYSADIINVGVAVPVEWFQISDNGTNLIFRIKSYNEPWQVVASVSRTSFMGSGPNGWGLYIDSRDSAALGSFTTHLFTTSLTEANS